MIMQWGQNKRFGSTTEQENATLDNGIWAYMINFFG